MPLELGIFLGAKRFGGERQEAKRALVIDIEPYRYLEFITNIRAMDIKAHAGDPKQVISIVRNWLTNVTRRRIAAAPLIIESFESFSKNLPGIAARGGFHLNEIPYVDFEFMVADWLLR
ncbi:MAG: hypothetical protein C0515_03985 [Novosphingobium sp.]|nr:hypothetical protein [Novosphingobium sp.]